MKRFLLVVAAATLATGCYAQGTAGTGYSYGYAQPGYSAGYAYASPDMYVMANGVNVVAYADYPTFYSDDYYWQYNNGLWYRSSYYGGGWQVSYDVPYRVRSIDRPYSYARFRPGAGWSRATAPAYQGGVRDHRTPRGGYQGGYTPPPTVRDHRSQPRPTYQPPVRDHRTNPPPVYQPPARDNRAPAQTYSPPVRDHRTAPPAASPPAPRGPVYVPRGGPTGNPPARDHRRR